MLRIVWNIIVAGMIAFLAEVPAHTQQIEGLHGEAAKAIAAEVRAERLSSPINAYVFYGDLTGRGTSDALALLYHPSGGNSDELTRWVFWDEGNGYRRTTSAALDEVFGVEPRNVKLSPGRVRITLTTMRPNDPRCCPSGETTYDISLDGAGGPKSVQGTPNRRWTVDEAADGRVTIKAHAVDGQAQFIGTCTATGGEPGLWSRLLLDGALLEGSEEPELLQFEIISRSGIQWFTVNTIHDQAESSRIAETPLARDFLDAFASGNEMRLTRGPTGSEIARFGLAGSAKAVAAMRQTCGAGLNVQAVLVELPFVNGRYLSDPTLCGLDDGQIVDRIGDEIYEVLYDIEDGRLRGGDASCDVLSVSRQGDEVTMAAQCASDGMVDNATLKMSFISDRSFRAGDRTFERCD